jgi:hypothetical protein
MIDERLPVGPDELILRRVRFFDPTLDIPVDRQSFKPVKPKPEKGTQGDADGISVFREACGATPAMLLEAISDPLKRRMYCVARLRIVDLSALGLEVTPDPDSTGPPGHALIPHLSWANYEKDEAWGIEVTLALAKLASERIVYS